MACGDDIRRARRSFFNSSALPAGLDILAWLNVTGNYTVPAEHTHETNLLTHKLSYAITLKMFYTVRITFERDITVPINKQQKVLKYVAWLC
jgi:hypothetical protein